MKFLTKLGGILMQATQIVTGFQPIAKAAFPKAANQIDVVSKDLAEVAAIIAQVEVVGQALQLQGSQKLTAAAPLVANVIVQSSILANHKIDNPALFQAGCEKIASGMADVLNSLKAEIDTTQKAA